MQRARGFLDLAFDVVEEATHLVERTHHAVVKRSVRRWVPIGPATTAAEVVAGAQTILARGVCQSIRGISGITRRTANAVADVVEIGSDRTPGFDDLARVTTSRPNAARAPAWRVDHLESVLNGFWGDYLFRRKNRLDLGMTLRHRGRKLPLTREALAAAFPDPTNNVCVFVHGLAATERLWNHSAEKHYGDPEVTFGTRLRDDLGFTPIFLQYNSGRHVSENGRALAALLSGLLDAYPIPIEQIAIVGHSMGGLVARSAAHYGREFREPWVAKLRHVACIGSPHLGAPLEKTANLLAVVLQRVERAGAQVPADLLDTRSAGVKDLRHGYTIDEEWSGVLDDDPFADNRCNLPLVDGVGYYFLAATISRDPGHPLGQMLGDLLVRLPSASGAATEPARRIHFSRGAVFSGMGHLQMVNHPDVYEVLRDLLAE